MTAALRRPSPAPPASVDLPNVEDAERQREALVRQYWRWAAWACPNGIPLRFELCRAYRSRWSP